MGKISKVAILGGTHGNELTGIHLLHRWRDNPSEVTRSTFSTELCLANPKACEENRRFVDEDLNRCFSNERLSRVDSPSYEAARASQLNQLLGPKGNSRIDFLIDLHTTTSNCGPMLVLFHDDPFNIAMAGYIQSKVPGLRLFFIPPIGNDQAYLSGLCPRHLCVEVGPIAQGLLNYEIFESSRQLVLAGLDFVEACNLQLDMDLPDSVEAFRFKESVYLPRDGEVFGAMIHESIQSRDFEPIHPGCPILRRLNGDEIMYEGVESVYPVFVNEAAYYYQGLAMSLATKERLAIPERSAWQL